MLSSHSYSDSDGASRADLRRGRQPVIRDPWSLMLSEGSIFVAIRGDLRHLFVITGLGSSLRVC